MKNFLTIFLLAATLVAVGGCGDGSATASADEEKAFKSPDKANLPTPKPGTPMSTPATSSLDDGKAPAGVAAGTPGASK